MPWYFFPGTRRLVERPNYLSYCIFLILFISEKTGRSVTGLDYYAWDKGPVPQDLFHELNKPDPDLKETIILLKQSKDEDNKLCQIIAKKPFDAKFFTRREIKIMKHSLLFFEGRFGKRYGRNYTSSRCPVGQNDKRKGVGKTDRLFIGNR